MNIKSSVDRDLDDFIYNMKKRLPANTKGRLNKTVVIQMILEEVFDEYSRLGDDSFLYKMIRELGD